MRAATPAAAMTAALLATEAELTPHEQRDEIKSCASNSPTPRAAMRRWDVI